MTYETHSEAETMEFAGKLAAMLTPGDTVLLYGDLGAGESVLARGIARGMGIADPMPSPTFTLLLPYAGPDGRKLYHYDLYRLADRDEYYAAGLDEFIGGDGVAVVEWPQMADLAPVPTLEIELQRGEADADRKIEIENFGVAGFDPQALSEWRAKA